MNKNLTITIDKNEKDRLNRIALSYGLSLEDLAQKVLKELDENFAKDSFKNYRNPKALENSFTRAMNDWRAGRVQKHL